jgi:hypothetical protein
LVLLLAFFSLSVLRNFILASAFFIGASNIPFFFYHGIGFAFFQSNFRSSVNLSEMILYDWIPFCSIVALTILEAATALYNRRTQSNLGLKAQIEIISEIFINELENV